MTPFTVFPYSAWSRFASSELKVRMVAYRLAYCALTIAVS